MHDLIDRQAAIDAVCKACANSDDYVDCIERRPESTFCDEIVSLRKVPSAQPDLQSTCNELAICCKLEPEVFAWEEGELSAQPERMSVNLRVEKLSKHQSDFSDLDAKPERKDEIVRCKDCKYYIPYDWMFDGLTRSSNINDYSQDEIGCAVNDHNYPPEGFCSCAERRE